jgi:hypothetical protein
MPTFESEEVYITPEDFVDNCSPSEIRELVDYLRERDYISETEDRSNLCIPESEIEEALDKLHGKYRNLSTEEENIIKKIANRF